MRNTPTRPAAQAVDGKLKLGFPAQEHIQGLALQLSARLPVLNLELGPAVGGADRLLYTSKFRLHGFDGLGHG